MKYTLLEMTQNVLSSMGSDQVNSITDTDEAQQVALIAKTVFYDMASELNLPEHHTLFELQASLDADKPTLMYRPDTAHNVMWLKYNVATADDPTDNFRLLTYLPADEFFNWIHNLKTTEDNVISFEHTVNTDDTLTFFARNDIAPTYYTTFDDSTVVFDAYDSEVDATLQKTKTLAFGGRASVFTMADNFIPPLDEQQFALYYNEVKSLAWMELKEIPHGKAEQAAKRQRAALQRNKDAFGTKKTAFDRLPNYGRK